MRFEATNEDNRGNQDLNGVISPLRQTGSYFDALPSAELKYAVTPGSAIRLAYSRGLARPNFGDLAPYLSLSVAGSRNASSIGYPNLKATHADNIDLLFEQYLRPLGMIQAGYFYKNIGEPIVAVQTNVSYPGIPQSFIQTQPVNADSAWCRALRSVFNSGCRTCPAFCPL